MSSQQQHQQPSSFSNSSSINSSCQTNSYFQTQQHHRLLTTTSQSAESAAVHVQQHVLRPNLIIAHHSPHLHHLQQQQLQSQPQSSVANLNVTPSSFQQHHQHHYQQQQQHHYHHQQQQQQQIIHPTQHYLTTSSSSSISPNTTMNQSTPSASTNPITHSVNPIPNTSVGNASGGQQQQQSQPATSQSHQMALAPVNSGSVGVSGGSGVNPLQELLSLFECPVCFEFALPPIMQCQSGHIVCSNCRPKLTCCPTCRSALGNIRNLSMEKIAYSIKFPCKYTSYGCSECMSHEAKLEHEDVCEFRMYNCPCPGASCKWQGTLDQVMPHLVQQHKSITTLQGEDIVFLATDITLPGAVDWVMMQSCFGYHFMLVLEKQEKHESYAQFFAVVQLIGTRRQAERFVYKLELNGQRRRRLTWEATPRSIHDGVQQAITNSDCLVFDTQTAQLFADSGNLGINVTISLN